jgi:ADP-heptose:LPS heptosyltransferase
MIARDLLKRLERGGKRFFVRLAAGLFRFAGGSREPDPNPLATERLRSVLLLRPDRLGDFVLTVPAIRLLAARLPRDARFTLLVSTRNEALARWFFPDARRWVHGRGVLPFLRTFARLVTHRFDAAIDFHSYPFSVTTGLWTLLSGAPIRVGHRATDRNDELARAIFNQGVSVHDDNLHEMQKSLCLVERFAGEAKLERVGRFGSVPEFAEARGRLDGLLRADGVAPGTRLVGIHPTLGKQDNRWSQERYVELLRLLEHVPAVHVIAMRGVGEEREEKRFRTLAAGHGRVTCLPASDLELIVEAARRCAAVVCGDSGIAHVCALVAPVVVIFGPADPGRWSPVGPREVTILRAADRLCDSTRPDEVMRELARLGIAAPAGAPAW